MTNGSVFMGLKPYLTHMLISMLVYWRVERWCSLWGVLVDFSLPCYIAIIWPFPVPGRQVISWFISENRWWFSNERWLRWYGVQDSSSSQGMKDGSQVQSKPKNQLLKILQIRTGLCSSLLKIDFPTWNQPRESQKESARCSPLQLSLACWHILGIFLAF